MKRINGLKRISALLLAVLMCVSMLPLSIFAAETASYAKISTMDELTSGQYVLVTSTGYAPGVLDGSWITAAQPTVEGDTVTAAAGAVWTLTVDGSTAKLTDANSVTVAPKSGNTNGIQSGDYSWAVACADGVFTFSGQGSDTTILASNVGFSNKFRAYKTATVSGNPNSYPNTFSLYKLAESAGGDEETPEPTPAPTDPEMTVSTVAEAKAMASGTENITVKGTVVLVDGKNVVVQDATGGINLYFGTAPTDIAVGDVIQASGKRGAYKGLEQLTGVAEYTKDGTAELPAAETTIAAILADQDVGALESTRVVIKGAVIGAVNTSGNTTLTQGDATINIYKIPALESVAEGDTVDVTVVVSDFSGYQLRVASAADVVKVTEEAPAWNDVDKKYSVYEKVTAPENGDTVVLYNPGNAKALSSTDSGYYKAGVDAAVVGETYIASDSEVIEWTVGITDGVYTFTQDELKLGIEKSGNYVNLKTNAGDYGFTVEPFAEGGDLYKIYSSTVEGNYGHVYLEWYENKTAFSAYSTGADRVTEDVFGFSFYKLVREGVVEEEPEVPTEPTEPEIPEEPTGTTWTRVELADIQATDTVAITMTKGEETWALFNGNGASSAPTAVVVTVDGDTMTSEDVDTLSWNIVSDDNGLVIYKGGSTDTWLYSTNSNNGVRVGTNDNKYWVVDADTGYLKHVAQGRYLGVYTTKPDWRAYTNTTGNTAGQTLTFWKQGGAEEEPEVPTGIADGDYVIWAPAYNKALSSVKTGNYNVGVDVTLNGEVLSGYGETEIWTVTNNEDGTITISQNGSKLSMQANYSSLSMDAVNDTWALVALEGGLYNVQNTGRGNYLEWYNQYSNWSTYNSSSAATDGQFQIMFTPAEAAEEPEVPTGIADGDYVIWAPGYNMALSSVYGGFYNNGVEVALDGDKLTGYGSTEIWTVTNNEDGTISVSFGGQNLAMAASYTSMTLGEVNDKWILEDAGNGTWYVKNVAREAYMQWYAEKNYWSAYYSIAEGSESKFALQFTPAEAVEEPEIPTGIADGEYVIWAPAYNMALSTAYGGYYNNGVEVSEAGGVLSGYGNTEIWTVTNNEDGTITISCAEGKLAMGTSFSSMPLNDVNDKWTIEDAGNGLWYVKNVGRSAYIEWYASNKYWSGYGTINSGSEGMFALKFTPAAKQGSNVDSTVVENIAQWGGMTNAENTAFVYGDKYVSGDEADTEDKYTAVVSGKTVTPWSKGGNNEAPLYYMGGTGIGSGSNDYMQFAVNATGWGDMELSFRLRASNSGPGSFQLMYSADDGATWKNFTTGSYAYAYSAWNSEGSYPVSGEGAVADGIAKTSLAAGNYVSFVFDVPAGADNCASLLIRLVPGTEKANGKTGAIDASGTVRVDQVILSGSPIVADTVTGFVSVEPDGTEDQPAGTALTMTSATEGATIYYRVNGGEWQTYDPENKPTLDTLPCDVEACAASEGKADSVVMLYHYAAGSVEAVRITPNGGGIYISDESAEITLSTDTEGATIWYATSADGVTFTEFAEYTDPIVVEKGFGQLSVSAYATKDGYKDTEVITRDFKERLSAYYNIYFGQLHSHTNISDGAGSVEEAFQYASNVKNLDFLAVTDHSNSFDGEANGVLSEDGSAVSSEWAQGHAAAKAVTDEDFVGLYGFEMTWSGGAPGHINTFNTPGWQSRTQAAYKDKSRNALQNYYDTLATVPDSISQFNHPGNTFGDFFDFDCYSETSDDLITLIEVGNGEGAIGSSGYFPSYEYYTRALDKGWHVAPTNNQDNHKGMWGDSNTGRSVILADSLTEADIYDALRNYRVYATEDNDLNIYYTLNGSIMGSQLYSADVEDTVSLSVTLSDVTDDANAKVEVIVNGGLVLASKTATCNETVTFGVSSAYNYYYIKVTQADGDIAVTAPVWIGQVEAVGISSLEAASELTIAGEEQTFTMEMFNNERKDLEVQSVVFTDKATGEVIHTDTTITKVESEGTASCTFGHTFEKDGIYTITATVKAVLNGLEKTYTQDLELTVMPDEITSRVIVDGSHNNDYVSGYYAGNMGNMTSIAAAEGIQVHVEMEKITVEMLQNCSLLVISAPNTRTGESYPLTVFEDEFIELVAEYVKGGGNVIICGLADYQDKQNDRIHETSVQLNKLLEAMGSTMKINDDEAYDEERNGGQAYRLYPESFNMDSEWCEGIQEGQTYSQYSGCTVDVGSGTWLVKGFNSTYSIDSDKDGKGGVEKGEAYFLAAEDTPYGGTIFAAGGVFLSDFEVKAELDNIWDLPYANRTIYENILGITRKQPVITPIADVRTSAKAGLGEIFVVEGYVTAGTANENTKFFDAIYLQDETGGITVYPYSELGLELGTKMRITGYTDAYQGDIEIQIINYQILGDEKNVIAPEKMTASDAMNYDENGGELIQVQGEVISAQYTTDGKGVAQFVIRENGTTRAANEAKIFIDGYILSGTTGENTLADIVQVGNTVSAVGLLYMHPEGDSTESVAVLRVRDCDEVVLISEKEEEPTPEPTTEPPTDPTTEPTEDPTTKPTEKPTEKPTKPTTKPTKPSDSTSADTSDSSLIADAMFLMAAALVAMAVLMANRKRWFGR